MFPDEGLVGLVTTNDIALFPPTVLIIILLAPCFVFPVTFIKLAVKGDVPVGFTIVPVIVSHCPESKSTFESDIDIIGTLFIVAECVIEFVIEFVVAESVIKTL
jgi:hypothetical protein